MLKLDDFKSINLSERQIFVAHYSKFPQSHSENLFTSLISWTHFNQAYYSLRDNALLLMNPKDGKPQFRPPIGARNDALLKEVIEIAKNEGSQNPVVAIDRATKTMLDEIFPGILITPDEDFFDYVYLAISLAELPGKSYLKHRNHLNRFRKQYKYSVEPASASNMEEIGKFLQKWCLWRDCASEPLLDAERTAILFCMEHFFELELSGIILRIDGEVQALSVYEQMNSDTAVIHFEKAMPDFDGIYQAINNEAAKLLAPNFKFINRESDLGIAGLRTAKQRLHPDHMVKVYYIARENL